VGTDTTFSESSTAPNGPLKGTIEIPGNDIDFRSPGRMPTVVALPSQTVTTGQHRVRHCRRRNLALTNVPADHGEARGGPSGSRWRVQRRRPPRPRSPGLREGYGRRTEPDRGRPIRPSAGPRGPRRGSAQPLGAVWGGAVIQKTKLGPALGMPTGSGPQTRPNGRATRHSRGARVRLEP
jgi:hypothetical protein